MSNIRKKPLILTIFGTRPEAIKLFPVALQLEKSSAIEAVVCVTAQHRQMLDQVLKLARLEPDYDLDIMRANQNLDQLTASLLSKIGGVLDEVKPDRVVVQGDTTTAMTAALSSYYRKIPVSHVEAGLRSGDIYNPWPEEVNRKIVATIADQHFAPTATSANYLKGEKIDPSKIFITGNTVIDALFATKLELEENPGSTENLDRIITRFSGKKIIGVTSHRRENFDGGLANIAAAIKSIAKRDDIAVIFPVHPNPNVRAVMESELVDLDNVALVEPLDYPNFVKLLSISNLMLTDSGGVQEEAPSLGKPVLVMRDTTERPEGVEAGTAMLVGTNAETIVSKVTNLLDDSDAYEKMSKAHNPYGDGTASQSICKYLIEATTAL